MGYARNKDDYASLKQHLNGKDPGGISPPTAAQLAADRFHVNAAKAHLGGTRTAPSQQAFELRCDELLSLVRSHVINDGVKRAVDAMVKTHFDGSRTEFSCRAFAKDGARRS